MTNQELQDFLKRIPATAPIEIMLPSGAHVAIDRIHLKVPSTVLLSKPGLSWSESISDAISGVIVAAPPLPETKP